MMGFDRWRRESAAKAATPPTKAGAKATTKPAAYPAEKIIVSNLQIDVDENTVDIPMLSPLLSICAARFHSYDRDVTSASSKDNPDRILDTSLEQPILIGLSSPNPNSLGFSRGRIMSAAQSFLLRSCYIRDRENVFRATSVGS